MKQWGGVTVDYYWSFCEESMGLAEFFTQCDPPQDGILSPHDFGYGYSALGKHQWLCVNVEQHWPDYCEKVAFDILEFEVVE